jgi:hypothetical protein
VGVPGFRYFAGKVLLHVPFISMQNLLMVTATSSADVFDIEPLHSA